MAIVIDPDNISREQIIYNTESQLISVYPVGTLAHGSASGSTGSTSGTLVFSDAGATFQTWSITSGDILNIYTGPDAGHYLIASVGSETSLTVTTFTGFTAFSTTSNIVWEIRNATGGSVADGVTLQAIYSFSKEEWRTDTETYGGDDLIRHEFPFEAITSEQFEIGGTTAHADWGFFNGPSNTDKTSHYIRTGGWATKNTANSTLLEYTGIITLGTLDADAQVYYQQTDNTTNPVDFILPGAVNQAIQTYENGGDDNRTYLKLFVRKKGKTYAQSEIADIGVSTIKTIVNRFPLSHTNDPAITSTDGEVVSQSPYTANSILSLSGDQNDGVTTIGTGTFTDSDATFITDSVQVGDALYITAGVDEGYYHILSVDSETQLSVSTADGTFNGDTGIVYQILTKDIIPLRTNDGTLADVSGVTGTLSSTLGGFNAAGITAGDLVIITESGVYKGIYPVITKDSDTLLTVNTTDKQFSTVGSIDYKIVQPGMYLQYKWDEITISSHTSLTFADANPDTITRTAGNWISDGVEEGDVVVIANATISANNGSYTIANVSASDLTLVSTDSLTASVNDAAATINVYRGFKRTISGVIYSFKWRLLGNDASLTKCYEYVQHQLRQTTAIDYGPSGNYRGDVMDLLLSFSTPTGTSYNMYVDGLNAVDTNNITYIDATGNSRVHPFVAAGSILFNSNLVNDSLAKYWMFFTTLPGGADFSTKDAVIVQDSNSIDITGLVAAQSSISFTFDYDGNVQGGRTAGTDADVTVVAIGLTSAQYVIATGTIERSKANNFALVATLERNYSNPV